MLRRDSVCVGAVRLKEMATMTIDHVCTSYMPRASPSAHPGASRFLPIPSEGKGMSLPGAARVRGAGLWVELSVLPALRKRGATNTPTTHH